MKNILPFEEGVIGEIYYCKSYVGNEYIFQKVEGAFCSPAYRITNKEYASPLPFNMDWRNGSDQEIRRATIEERELFLSKVDREELLPIPEQEISYQIY